MRVLLDENLPRAFASELKGHRVRTVQSMGWSGTKNGTIRPPDLSGPEKHRKRKGSADWVARVEEKHEAFLILNRERVSHSKRLLTHARKFHKKYGLARVDHLLDEPECSDIPHRHRIVEQLLQASEDAWVGSDGGGASLARRVLGEDRRLRQR